MSRTSYFTLEGSAVEGREDEFYQLWLIALATFGVGDLVTTIAFYQFTPLEEGNPIVRAALEALGIGGFVLLKIALFLGVLLLSVGVLNVARSRFVYYFGPAVLSIYGAFLTIWNILGMVGYG